MNTTHAASKQVEGKAGKTKADKSDGEKRRGTKDDPPSVVVAGVGGRKWRTATPLLPASTVYLNPI